MVNPTERILVYRERYLGRINRELTLGPRHLFTKSYFDAQRRIDSDIASPAIELVNDRRTEVQKARRFNRNGMIWSQTKSLEQGLRRETQAVLILLDSFSGYF